MTHGNVKLWGQVNSLKKVTREQNVRNIQDCTESEHAFRINDTLNTFINVKQSPFPQEPNHWILLDSFGQLIPLLSTAKGTKDVSSSCRGLTHDQG